MKTKLLFASYIKMMTKGCHKERCDNIYCAKNPSFIFIKIIFFVIEFVQKS